jgi:multifunctional cyclase/dehydratase/O-methyltransferase
VFEEIACQTFANSVLSECLRTDVAGSVRPLVILRGGADTLAAFGELLFCVTTGKPSFEKLWGSEMFAHLRRSPGQALLFDDAMTALTALWAARIAAAYEFAPWGSLMDVGGGNGLLLAEILRVHQGLHGVLAEQPDVLERARQRGFFASELADRVQFEPCDFLGAIPCWMPRLSLENGHSRLGRYAG